MTESSPAEQEFVLQPRPPVRALAISAGAAVVAVALIVWWQASDLAAAVLVIGLVLLALAVALATVAVVLTRRLRTVIRLTGSGLSVHRGGQTRTRAWSEVTAVKLTGPRLIVADRAGGTLVITNPGRASDPRFRALTTSVQSRLDTDRGYRPAKF